MEWLGFKIKLWRQKLDKTILQSNKKKTKAEGSFVQYCYNLGIEKKIPVPTSERKKVIQN